MLYAILCYHEEAVVNAWSKAEDEAVLAKRRKVQKEMVETGRMGPAVRLVPTTGATTIRTSGNEQLVLDGPFAETKEQLLGFYTIEAADLEEAVAFARELSDANPSGGSYEIRPVGVYNPVAPTI